ncbi:hypothetical protein [Pseudoalteromonas luteoviolacea]|uniref:Uncharacterized protein n=1 Tax=Pseudoalteromonas luteoviolacea S4054 TaxID=1129367 RepID=A0A0F6AHK3_9GAMM|nr:hypothetical protein [Pseudoalteromonas luteoviolacea]AOT07281.1 hypothetical protein S4054249_05185 [Pseudoalteromonas luteoviolacea]AOT12196.1 hypothetical protein S40542_05185 [Pseudoalteromonas luteoviolacea]AOT17109.1 hypothetical protein S4054_05185 [Pseudoalteromonas luteoviolacea]KKE85692.1 hypothetical protein N479_25000 [Pseudoalteromonas luteoviolacea S4054]KZN70969.1 hypothetical protein N481_20515 [Pseudoalteromonas luteoviolacea S4047-1]
MDKTYTGEQLAQLYQNIRLEHEESIIFVDCGFKGATLEQKEILSALKRKRLTQAQLESVKPFFLLKNIQIEEYVKVKKRFFFSF